MEKALSTWRKMIALWHEQQVPSVQIRAFDIKSQMSFAPWRRKDGPYIGDTNPLRSTAYHLAVYLQNASLDLLAAYKLHAFCVDNDLGYPHQNALAAGLAENGNDPYGWWHPNSRHVLPDVELLHGLERDTLRQWDKVVLAAAKEWTLISEKWVLVRVPDLMLDGSSEKAEWEAHIAQRREDAERREYERLKKKYGA